LKNGMIRVVIADDSLVFREAIASLLSQDPEILIVANASNGREAYTKCKEYNPDIVLMDVRMPVCDGIEGTKLIKDSFPERRKMSMKP
jgi:YesN/AraC family two-component response regulator